MSNQRRNNATSRIIEQATLLIEEQGLSNFRVDTLAERLDYSRQNLYRYFPNKKAILDAVVIEGSRAMAIAIAEQLENLDSPFDEQLIEGVLIASDIINGDQQINSYRGNFSISRGNIN